VGRRRKAREVVLQALYELEFSDRPWQEVLEDQFQRRASGAETARYARSLLEITLAHREELDRLIEAALEHWDLERVSLVDRNILRLALAELIYMPEVPVRVVIDEAIEVARKYSSADAGQFVNGVLDRLAREARPQEKW